MNTKKLSITLGCIFIASIVFSKILFYYVKSTTPNVVLEIENSRDSDPKLKSILGEPISFESRYNENDLQKDTLPFKIIFFGKKQNILINAIAKRQSESKWHLIKTDTTYFTR